MTDKTCQPSEVEGRIYPQWEEAGAFRAGRPERTQAEPYCIVIPPPNVTGSLHMGHALNNTLQDILARFERMRGRDVRNRWLSRMRRTIPSRRADSGNHAVRSERLTARAVVTELAQDLVAQPHPELEVVET